MTAIAAEPLKIVYWHRELPPLDTWPQADDIVEADSSRIEGTLAHRDELWDECYRDLMKTAEKRLAQEVARLGGGFAHVYAEQITPKRDDASGQAWLHGRFRFTLCSRAGAVA